MSCQIGNALQIPVLGRPRLLRRKHLHMEHVTVIADVAELIQVDSFFLLCRLVLVLRFLRCGSGRTLLGAITMKIRTIILFWQQRIKCLKQRAWE